MPGSFHLIVQPIRLSSLCPHKHKHTHTDRVITKQKNLRKDNTPLILCVSVFVCGGSVCMFVFDVCVCVCVCLVCLCSVCVGVCVRVSVFGVYVCVCVCVYVFTVCVCVCVFGVCMCVRCVYFCLCVCFQGQGARAQAPTCVGVEAECFLALMGPYRSGRVTLSIEEGRRKRREQQGMREEEG